MRLDGVLRDGICDLRFAICNAAFGDEPQWDRREDFFCLEGAQSCVLQNFVRGCARMAPPQVDGLCGFFERSMYANSACER
jgi:hypothetical protein